MKKIILIVFSMMTIVSNSYGVEKYWIYLVDTVFSSEFYGWHDVNTNTYLKLGTDERLCETDNEILVVDLVQRDFRIKIDYKPKHLEELSNRYPSSEYVITTASDNGNPILIALPSYLFIPSSKIYSTKYGARTMYPESGDFWNGFITGLKYGYQKFFYNIQLKSNLDNYRDELFIWEQGPDFVIKHCNEVLNVLKLARKTDQIIALQTEINKSPLNIKNVNSVLNEAYSALPPTLERELLRNSLDDEFRKRDTELCVKLNILESNSFHQSLGAINGRGFKCLLLRNSETIGMISPLIIISILIFIILYRIKQNHKQQ